MRLSALSIIRLHNFRVGVRVWISNVSLLLTALAVVMILALAIVQASIYTPQRPGKHYASDDDVENMVNDQVTSLGREYRAVHHSTERTAP